MSFSFVGRYRPKRITTMMLMMLLMRPSFEWILAVDVSLCMGCNTSIEVNLFSLPLAVIYLFPTWGCVCLRALLQ